MYICLSDELVRIYLFVQISTFFTSTIQSVCAYGVLQEMGIYCGAKSGKIEIRCFEERSGLPVVMRGLH